MFARIIAAASLALLATVALAAPKKGAAKPVEPTPEMMKAGEQVYAKICTVCHQKTGMGLAPLFPPLAGSDYLMADKKRSIVGVLAGQSGPMEVNGKKYNQVMPPLPNLSDEEVANVLTYVRNSWGNKGEAVTPAEVKEVRASLPKADAGTKK